MTGSSRLPLVFLREECIVSGTTTLPESTRANWSSMDNVIERSKSNDMQQSVNQLGDGLLDWTERLVVLGFYSWLVIRLLMNWWINGGLAGLLLLPSEGLIVFFILIRKQATKISRLPSEWLLAMAATCVPMLVLARSDATLI